MSAEPHTGTAATAGMATTPPIKALPTTALPVPAGTRSIRELRADAASARGELASTLDALDHKLNVPKQIRITQRRITLGLRKLGEDNPIALVGVAVAAACVAGAAVWLGVRTINRR